MLKNTNAVWVLDAHGILYQVFHALPSDLSSSRGEPVGAIFGFVRDLLTLYFDHKPASLLCTFDMPGPTFRHEIDVEYKANRKEMPEPLSMQIKLLHPVLEAFGIPMFGLPSFEADDLMATIATEAEKSGRDCVLVTADKDCRQLITDHVSLFNLRKQAFYKAENLLEDWGIRPNQVVDFQAMVGDASDNVPGIPLIGPKIATQLLQQYETLDNVLDRANEVSGKKRKENLQNGRDAAMMSRELVQLRRDVPMEIDWDAGLVQGFDGELLKAMCHRFNFRSLLPKIEQLEQAYGSRIIEATASREMIGEDTTPITHGNTPSSDDDDLPLMRFANEQQKAKINSEKASRIVSRQSARSLFVDDNTKADDSPDEAPPKVDAKYRLVNDEPGFREFLAALQSHIDAEKADGKTPCFSFDLETTALEYVNANIVGMSFCWQNDVAWYLALRAPLGEETLKQEAVFAELKPIFENADIGKIGQNIKYDMLILRKFGLRLVGVRFDTMVADYLLHAGEQRHNLDDLAERYLKHTTIKIKDLIGTGKKQRRMDEVSSYDVSDYAAEDALIPWLLRPILERRLHKAKLFGLFERLELPLIDVLVELEANGITIDVEQLRKLSGYYAERLTQLESEIFELAGESFNVASPKQLQAILFEKLKLPVIKKTKTGPSTDIEVLEQLAGMHPIAAKMIETRQASKLKGTYIDALPLLADPQTHRVHASFNQVVTATGRLSSSDPNLQNIPIRTEEGRAIRAAFVPGKPFDAILSCDYSQIELRVLAHFTGDENLRAAFESGEDIHASVASQVYHVPLGEVTSEMRRTAKAVNFGIIYGQSAFGLGKQLGIDQREAANFIEAYFAKYPTINAFLDETLDACLTDGYVTTYAGRVRHIAGIRPHRVGQLNLSERTAINTVIQGSAADLMKMAMLNVYHRMKKNDFAAQMLLQIHDELVFEIQCDQAPPFENMLREEMSLGQPLNVPLAIDVVIGNDWGEAK